MSVKQIIGVVVAWLVAFGAIVSITNQPWIAVNLTATVVLVVLAFYYIPEGRFRNWIVGIMITGATVILFSTLVKDKVIPLPEISPSTKEAIDQGKADTTSKVTETVRPLGPGTKQIAQYYADHERVRKLALVDEIRQALDADITARGDVGINDPIRVKLEAKMLFAAEQLREWDRSFREAAGLRPLTLQIIWAVFAAIVLLGGGLYLSKKETYWVNTWGLRILAFGLWLGGYVWIGEYYKPHKGFESLFGPLKPIYDEVALLPWWLVGISLVVFSIIILRMLRTGTSRPAAALVSTSTATRGARKFSGFWKFIAVVILVVLGLAWFSALNPETKKDITEWFEGVYRGLTRFPLTGMWLPDKEVKWVDAGSSACPHGAELLTLQKDVWSKKIKTIPGCLINTTRKNSSAHLLVRVDNKAGIFEIPPGPGFMNIGEVKDGVEYKLINMPTVELFVGHTPQ